MFVKCCSYLCDVVLYFPNNQSVFRYPIYFIVLQFHHVLLYDLLNSCRSIFMVILTEIALLHPPSYLALFFLITHFHTSFNCSIRLNIVKLLLSFMHSCVFFGGGSTGKRVIVATYNLHPLYIGMTPFLSVFCFHNKSVSDSPSSWTRRNCFFKYVIHKHNSWWVLHVDVFLFPVTIGGWLHLFDHRSPYRHNNCEL